jgi:protein transport protein SEC24
LPGDGRTQIGFITYDSSVHFYNLAEGLSQPQQMIVVDTDGMFAIRYTLLSIITFA